MHSYIVWYIALAYFATQLLCFVLSCLSIRKQFATWKSQVEKGDNLTRADALSRLDKMLTCIFWRASLKKLGYCATLLGILLTGIGFLLFQSPDTGAEIISGGKIEFSQVLSQLQPLYVGVVAGTALALINQILVHFVDWHAAEIRLAAEASFLTATIKPIKDAIEYLGGVIHAMAAEAQLLMQKQVASSKKSLEVIQQMMEASCKEMSQLTLDYKKSSLNVKNESDKLEAELKTSRASANQSIAKLNETLLIVGQGLGVASSQVKAAGNELASNLAAASKATLSLEQASTEVGKAATAATETSRAASELLGHAMGVTVPARKAAEQANLATERVANGAKSLEAASVHLNSGTGSLSETIRNIESVSRASKSFLAEAARIEPSMTQLEQLLSQLKSMAEDLPDEVAAALQSRIFSTDSKSTSPKSSTGLAGLFNGGANRKGGE